MLTQDAVPTLLTDDHRTSRHRVARSRLRRDELWIGITALVAAMLALPLAQTGSHGPEVAAVLAVGATALLAGQRWAIAIVVLAELLLIATDWPRAFLTTGDLMPRLAALGSLIAIAPGALAGRRAAAALVLITGRQRTQRTCRQFYGALVGVAALAVVVPMF